MYKDLTYLNSSIWIKTIKYEYNNLDNLEYEMKFVSTKGYCEKEVESMASVSNGKLCGGVNSNVGFRYTIIFPTCE
jgi:hypothetical protein